MTENMSEHDPYRGMETAEKDIRPGFLQATDKNKEKEKKSKNAAEGLGTMEKKATSGLMGEGGESESALGGGGIGIGAKDGGGKGLFSGTGRAKGIGKIKMGRGKFGFGKMSAGAFIALGLVAAIAAVGSIGTPLMMIGALDYNLQRALGFSFTSAILEKQAEHITGEMLSRGEVPDGYAADLAAAGMTVGQVTAKGDFVRTNVYVADADKLKELATVGTGFQTIGSEGELSILFDGDITSAEDFVLAVESNPKMYAAYSKAANVSSRYYYGNNVNKVYQDMGVSRDSFANWKSVGDQKLDQESFDTMLAQALDKEASTSLAGCGDEDCSETGSVSGVDADEVVSKTSSSAGGTKNAAQLLNSAISSEEPYKAASAFVAIEEPIQRTRLDGDGPAHEVMNTLSKRSIVTYEDVNTGEEVEREASILETDNFAAAVSWGNYSRNEANNFSRDRILHVTDTDDSSLLKDTTVGETAGRKSDIASKSGGGSADDDTMDKTIDSVAIGITEKNSDLFPSVIGGNRIVEGGSFLSNKINLKALGAMPSDEATISVYNHEAKEVLARRAEAERATLSPFDISSPNTFLGSIVHGFAMGMLKMKTSSGATTITRATTGLAGRSVKRIFGEAQADGNNEDFQSTFGGKCNTVNSTGAEADLYCTQMTTVYTGMMDKDEEYWKEKMKEGSDEYKDYEDYVLAGMNRESTFGTKDAGVCKAYKEEHSDFVDDILDSVSSFFGVYKECDRVDNDVSTGEKYTLKGDHKEVKKYSAFTLHDTVSSMLSETESTAQKILNEYYAKHPVDNSPAGIIARRSGMTKDEAQIALNYANYLYEIARYDASDRYVFGSYSEAPMQKELVSYTNRFNETIYCFWRERTNYGDARNQVYLV